MSASASAFPFLSLADLGWDDAWAATLATAVQMLGPADPARVARVDLGACTVLGAAGAGWVTVPPGTTVAVGDWLLVHRSRVVGALPRRTARRELDRLAARDDPALRQQLRTEQRRLYREYAQTRKQWRRQGR